jgi:hypothetical protein
MAKDSATFRPMSRGSFSLAKCAPRRLEAGGWGLEEESDYRHAAMLEVSLAPHEVQVLVLV